MARIEAEREAGIHFRPGYEYGPGPDDLPENLYGPDGAPFYNYLGPEDTVPEPPFSNTPILEPPLQPSELQLHYIASHSGMCSKTGEETGTAIPLTPSTCLPHEDREGERHWAQSHKPSLQMVWVRHYHIWLSPQTFGRVWPLLQCLSIGLS